MAQAWINRAARSRASAWKVGNKHPYHGYANQLIAKWKKPSYERLCCLRCMQPGDHNFQTTCAYRVSKHLREEQVVECMHCGCGGGASGD
ncbi:G10 family protein [Striga hermonthica]|uniref:G10 family protein n=1 Tax=Striga hermonthica TaxID=68872 RepID=A0A9N7NLA5_STRHE|nr:G10 family protein [Striga hermonthica]